MKFPIYLDYSSTTPVDSRVLDVMIRHMTLNGIFGNPSSESHLYGWHAAESVDYARQNIARLIGSDFREIIFTSGSTESNNLALKGIAYGLIKKGKHIITSETEHKSILDTCLQLEKEGFNITKLKPQRNGLILLTQLINAIRKDTILVSIMYVNNETGVIQDISAFGDICREKQVYFHVDAAQSIGKFPINLSSISIDLMSFNAHKLYGPKGIGCLFIRHKIKNNLCSQMHGGFHEYGMRAGTLPVHQIVGMGKACKIIFHCLNNEINRLKQLKYQLWNGLKDIEGIVMNGELCSTVSSILNVSFHKIYKCSLLELLPNLAISNGSACMSGKNESSYVLKSMGINDIIAKNSIRFSLGRFTTVKEIEYTIKYIKDTINLMK